MRSSAARLHFDTKEKEAGAEFTAARQVNLFMSEANLEFLPRNSSFKMEF